MGKQVLYLFIVLITGVCGVSWGQGKATAPNPADGATDVLAPLLRWTAGAGAVLHNVYLGTTPELGPEQLVAPKYASTVYWHLGGIVSGTTYYWRIDEIQADGVTVVTGDVWTFIAQPLTAFMPNPADGGNAAPVAPDLTWMKGQAALEHHVYFGQDRAAVAAGDAATDKGIVTDPNYAPGELLPLTTYYWRVDEITPGNTVVTGLLWRFTTVLPVDDFESYDDDQNRIYDAWVDGYADQSSGSTVGLLDAVNGTFGETKIVHRGVQSMPLDYNNVKSPFFSEATYSFAGSQNWTADGVDTLTLFVRGRPLDFEIQSVSTPPVIDGQVDAVWQTVAPLPLKTTIAGTAPDNAADASGQFRVLYDATYLYAIVDINDESKWNDSGSSYLDDSVEFYVDGDNTKAPPGLSGNNRQYTFGWTTTEIQGTNTDLTGVEHQQVNTATGWRIEMKFPWQSLKGTGAPVGQLIGIDCFYNDDDDGTDTRESQIAWHSTVGNDWQTAASWGTAMVLAPQAGAAPDPLYVTIQDASNKKATAVHPDPAVKKSQDWVEWSIPLSDFAGVNLGSIRKLYIGIGDRANPAAGGSGIIYVDDIYLTKPAPEE